MEQKRRRSSVGTGTPRRAGIQTEAARRRPGSPDGSRGRAESPNGARRRPEDSGGSRGRTKGQSKERRRPESGSSYRARRRRRNERLRRLLPVFLLLLIIACFGGTLLLYRANRQSAAPDVTVDLEQLDSPYAVLLDRGSGEILASKKGSERIYPASLVKIMTVLTALENLRDLKKTVTLSYDYFQELYDRDASRAGFEPGEEARIIDLMYGAILPSGAECCRELALQCSGSEEAFVGLMNEKAEKLGLSGSHYCNSTGLHDPDQYATAEDIARLLNAALKNKTFYKIITSKSYTVPASNVHPDGFTFHGSMFSAIEDPSLPGGQILGGKTGYTDNAGRCLASFAEVNGREYILVTAGFPAEPRSEQYHIDDAFRAYRQIGDAAR